MKLFVGGQGRSSDLEREVAESARQARSHPAVPEFLVAHKSALHLCTARDEADYLDKLVDLMWDKTGISTVSYYVPRGPGLKGRIGHALRSFLWKLLRYQHDRMAFQQNMINAQLTIALEFLRDQNRREVAELRREIEALLAAGGPAEGGRKDPAR